MPWRWLLLAALTMAVGQFSLLYEGIRAGMPAGLSSVVLQSQAIFTVVFAVLLLGERPARPPGRRPGRGHRWGSAWSPPGSVPTGPAVAFVLVLAAAASWGAANLVIRAAAPADMLGFMVWVSASPRRAGRDRPGAWRVRPATWPRCAQLDLTAVGSLAYIAWLSTLAGWGAWGVLIRRYGAATVAPFSMLVPFFGLTSAALALGEPVHLVDVLGGVLVVGGVLLGAIRRRAPAVAKAPERTLVA